MENFKLSPSFIETVIATCGTGRKANEILTKAAQQPLSLHGELNGISIPEGNWICPMADRTFCLYKGSQYGEKLLVGVYEEFDWWMVPLSNGTILEGIQTPSDVNYSEGTIFIDGEKPRAASVDSRSTEHEPKIITSGKWLGIYRALARKKPKRAAVWGYKLSPHHWHPNFQWQGCLVED